MESKDRQDKRDTTKNTLSHTLCAQKRAGTSLENNKDLAKMR